MGLLLAELLIAAAVLGGAGYGIRAGYRALKRQSLAHADWRPAVRTEGGHVIYRVERPGDEPQEVGRVATSDPNLEDSMLDLEVRADGLAEALNRGRRRA